MVMPLWRFLSINPVRPELINLETIFEEMWNVISFATAVTSLLLSLTLMSHDQLLHGLTLCTTLY